MKNKEKSWPELGFVFIIEQKPNSEVFRLRSLVLMDVYFISQFKVMRFTQQRTLKSLYLI